MSQVICHLPCSCFLVFFFFFFAPLLLRNVQTILPLHSRFICHFFFLKSLVWGERKGRPVTSFLLCLFVVDPPSVLV